jgi:photosystem II stability/assembly factor-like uncharacterized protein
MSVKIFIRTILFYSIIFIYTTNAQWIPTNGPGMGSVVALAVSGNDIFAGSAGGIFLTTDNGTSWTSVYRYGDLPNIRAIAVDGSNVFAATTDGIILSTDNGKNWGLANNGLNNIYVFSLKISGTNIFAGTFTNGIFLSTDNGTSWKEANDGIPDTIVGIYSFAASGSNIFAGTSLGKVYLSTNNGTNWTLPVSAGLMVTAVGPLAVSGSNLFAGILDGGVFLSTDDGASWTAINNGITNPNIPDYPNLPGIICLAVSDSNIFAGTDVEGIFLSTDNGASWKAVNDGLTTLGIYSLVIKGGYIFAGSERTGYYATAGGIVWRRPLSELITDVKNADNYLPNDFSLSQNCPNPFNPSTKISYSVAKESFVTIKVYDLLGREIKTLVNEDRPAGKYSVNFNANNLSSGIYLYTIKAGSFVQTKKMVLLK